MPLNGRFGFEIARGDHNTHGRESAVQSRLGGSQRNTHDRRDVGHRQACEVPQHDDSALFGFKVRKQAVELVSVGDCTGRIRLDIRDDRLELDFDRPATPPADGHQAGVDEDSVEPGVESLRVAETGQIAPGPQEGVLDHVVCEFAVPDDQPGGRVQPRDGDADKRGEGVMIASPCPLDESSLVHVLPAPRFIGDLMVALLVKVPARTETFPRSGLSTRLREVQRRILAGEEVGGGQLEK